MVRRWGNKYNVAPASEREFQGRVYASKAEREYAQILWNRREAGTIQLLVEQPSLWLGVPENVYRPDFLVVENGNPYFVDVKGVETPAFRKVMKLWANYGQCPLHIVKKKGAKFVTDAVIEAKR